MSESGNGAQNVEVQAQFGETQSAETENDTAKQEALDALNGVSKSEETAKPDLSRQFAALSRKDKEIRARETEAQSKIAELEAQLAELKSEPAKKEELPLEYRLKKDPINTLAEMGLSFDKLSEIVLNEGQLPNDMQLKLFQEDMESKYAEKMKEIESKLNEKEEQEYQRQVEAQVASFKSDINEHINSAPEKYELINATDSQELVYQIIEDYYNEEGKVLDIEVAAAEVEEHLEEEARKFMKLKKLQASETMDAPKPENPWTTTTLSNDHSAQSVNVPDRKLTREESLAKVADLLKWNS